MDMKFAFLNGLLQEEIYLKHPEGFSVPGNEDMVYVSKKSLYGLKQAPIAWYNLMDNHLLELGFKKSLSESILYVKNVFSNVIMVFLYVDNLLVTGNNIGLNEEFKEEMMKVFEMVDLEFFNQPCIISFH